MSELENSFLGIKIINQGSNMITYNIMEEKVLNDKGQLVLKLDRLGNMLTSQLTYRIFFANLMENISEKIQNKKPKMNNFQ